MLILAIGLTVALAGGVALAARSMCGFSRFAVLDTGQIIGFNWALLAAAIAAWVAVLL